MTTLVIPDIHYRHPQVDKIINHEQPNKVIFLGDHFDNYGDTPGQARVAAEWVKKRMTEHPEDEWILGNHDACYAWRSRYTICSGYHPLKETLIADVLSKLDWEKFKLHTWMGPYLLTHAGLHPAHLVGVAGKDKVENIKEFLVKAEEEAKGCLREGSPHWMIAAGLARGGRAKFGGVTWLDFTQEFVSVPNVNQIFGHTNMFAQTIGTVIYGHLTGDNCENYCLDTNNLYYAIWNGTELKIKFAPDEIRNWRDINVKVTMQSTP